MLVIRKAFRRCLPVSDTSTGYSCGVRKAYCSPPPEGRWGGTYLDGRDSGVGQPGLDWSKVGQLGSAAGEVGSSGRDIRRAGYDVTVGGRWVVGRRMGRRSEGGLGICISYAFRGLQVICNPKRREGLQVICKPS